MVIRASSDFGSPPPLKKGHHRLAVVDAIRVCNGITITFMHLRFRSSLPDPQSQNPRNSAAIPVVLLNQIRQT